MAMIDAKTIKELRERTGVGMGKCKEALEEVGGDLDKAIDLLRKAGMASAVKKESRETNEGKIEAIETADRIIFAEANAETDFVIKNDRFAAFHLNICEELLALEAVASLDDFLKETYSKNKDQTIDDYRKETISVLGENIVISRIFSTKKRSNHSYSVYSHMGGKIVTMVEIEGAAGETELARDIALHIAAEAPDYLREEDVPESVLSKEKEIATSQVKGKPENIVEKIVQGKLKAFFDQVCLLDQKFIKDPSITIAELVNKRSKEIGKSLKVVRFVRWQVGQ